MVWPLLCAAFAKAASLGCNGVGGRIKHGTAGSYRGEGVRPQTTPSSPPHRAGKQSREGAASSLITLTHGPGESSAACVPTSSTRQAPGLGAALVPLPGHPSSLWDPIHHHPQDVTAQRGRGKRRGDMARAGLGAVPPPAQKVPAPLRACEKRWEKG